MLNGTPGLLAGKKTHYEGSGEAVGDINGFEQECDILSKDPGDHSRVRTVSNWHLGSSRIKFLSRKSMNTSQITSVHPR